MVLDPSPPPLMQRTYIRMHFLFLMERMYICIHIYINEYTYIYMHTYIYVYMYSHMYGVFRHIYHTCIHTYFLQKIIYMYDVYREHIYMNILFKMKKTYMLEENIYIHVYIYKYTYLYIYIYIYIYIHTHTHMYTCVYTLFYMK